MSIEGKCEKCGSSTTDYRCVNCIEEELEQARLQNDLLIRIRDAYSEGLKGTAAHKCEDPEMIFKTCVGLQLQNGELKKALKEIMQLVQTPRPVGWTAEGTIYKVAEEALADKRVVSSPICRVQTNCHGGTCGNLLPCDVHPGQSW